MTIKSKIILGITILMLLFVANAATTYHALSQSPDGAGLMIGLTLVSLAVGFFLIFYFIGSINKPLNRIAYNMKQTQAGELTASIQIDSDDEFANVCHEINDFTKDLNSTFVEIDREMNELSRHASYMTATSLKSNQQAKTQQGSIDTLLDLATQMSESASDVASGGEAASGCAAEANDLCLGGQKLITQSATSIKEMAAEIINSVENINKLQSECQNVASVVEVISSIAEQTNLLALNAAIEAARAGEQGRGFAVVADEVRTLASRTQESTSEINKVIETLQGRADAAVGYMTQVYSKASGVVEETDQTAEALNYITEKVASIMTMNERIASVAEQQNNMSETIQENVSRVNKLSADTVDQTQEVMETGKKTSELAKKVHSLLSRFKFVAN
jgi:methyl-accepting chemotaxis protein